MAAAELTLHFKALKHTKQEFTLHVPADVTIAQLQQRITDAEHIPTSRQRLIFGGKVLKADQPLSAYGVEDGNALHLIVRQEAAVAGGAAAEDVPPPAAQAPPEQLLPAFGPQFMMGSAFNLGNAANGQQQPDLGQFVSSVLSSIGMPMGPFAQQQQQQQQHLQQAQSSPPQQQQSGSAAGTPLSASPPTQSAAAHPTAPNAQPQPPPTQVHIQVQGMPGQVMPGVQLMPGGGMPMQMVQGPNGPMLVPLHIIQQQQQQQQQPSTAAAATPTAQTSSSTETGSQPPTASPQQRPVMAVMPGQAGMMPQLPFPIPMQVIHGPHGPMLINQGPLPFPVQSNQPQPASSQHSSQQPLQPQQPQQPPPVSQAASATASSNAASPSSAAVPPPAGQPVPPGVPMQLTPMQRQMPLNINHLRDGLNASAAASTPHTPWAAPTSSPSFGAHHVPNLNQGRYTENVDGLIYLLGQTRAILSDAPASVAHVIAALQSQALPNSTMGGAERNKVQRDAHQLGLFFRRLGGALSGIGQLLTHVAPQAPGNTAPLALAPTPVVPLAGPVEVRQPIVQMGPPPPGQQPGQLMHIVQTPNGPMWVPGPHPNSVQAQQQQQPQPALTPSPSNPELPTISQSAPVTPTPAAQAANASLPANQPVITVGGPPAGFMFPFQQFAFPQPGPLGQAVQPGTVQITYAAPPQAAPITVDAAQSASQLGPSSGAAATSPPAPTGPATGAQPSSAAPDGTPINPFAAIMSQVLPTLQQAFTQQQQTQPAASADAANASASDASTVPDQASAAINGLIGSISPIFEQLSQTAQQQTADPQQQQQQAANLGNIFASMMGAFMQNAQQQSQTPPQQPSPTTAPAAPPSTQETNGSDPAASASGVDPSSGNNNSNSTPER